MKTTTLKVDLPQEVLDDLEYISESMGNTPHDLALDILSEYLEKEAQGIRLKESAVQ